VERERRTIEALLEAIRAGGVRSAHDCADGGLGVALAECAIMDPERLIGAEVDLSEWAALPLRAVLFGEAQARFLVSTPLPARVLAAGGRWRIPARVIGYVRAASAGLAITVGARRVRAPVERLARAYHEAIPALMARAATVVATTETLITPAT
jgi:phosphoribosylformylglycinamidine synthase